MKIDLTRRLPQCLFIRLTLVYTNTALSTLRYKMENSSSKNNQGTEQLRQELQRQEILYLWHFKELFSRGEDIHFSDGFGVLSYPFIYVAKIIMIFTKAVTKCRQKSFKFCCDFVKNCLTYRLQEEMRRREEAARIRREVQDQRQKAKEVRQIYDPNILGDFC